MGALASFSDGRFDNLLLIRTSLGPVQFDTLHPFLYGSGQFRRLLITFLLCALSATRQSILYPSLKFKTPWSACNEILECVRSEGDWKAWLELCITRARWTVKAG